jgi:hypothetical protein
MDNGFIKLHRKITEWEWYQDTNTFKVFLHLLLYANHKLKRWKGIEIQRGQLITGRKKLASELHLSEQAIRTVFDKLKSTGEITTKTTNRITVVTICKYDLYNDYKQQEQPAKQPQTQPTSNQQTTTTKNDKNNKEEKKIDANIVFECMVRASIGKEVSHDFLWKESYKLIEKYKNVSTPKLQGLVNSWVGNLKLKDKNRHISLNSFI